MANIITDLLYLNATKELIRQAIINKGVELDYEEPFRAYADKIRDIIIPKVIPLFIDKNGQYDESNSYIYYSPIDVNLDRNKIPKLLSGLTAYAQVDINKGETVYFDDIYNEWIDVTERFSKNEVHLEYGCCISSNGNFIYSCELEENRDEGMFRIDCYNTTASSIKIIRNTIRSEAEKELFRNVKYISPSYGYLHFGYYTLEDGSHALFEEDPDYMRWIIPEWFDLEDPEFVRNLYLLDYDRRMEWYKKFVETNKYLSEYIEYNGSDKDSEEIKIWHNDYNNRVTEYLKEMIDQSRWEKKTLISITINTNRYKNVSFRQNKNTGRITISSDTFVGYECTIDLNTATVVSSIAKNTVSTDDKNPYTFDFFDPYSNYSLEKTKYNYITFYDEYSKTDYNYSVERLDNDVYLSIGNHQRHEASYESLEYLQILDNDYFSGIEPRLNTMGFYLTINNLKKPNWIIPRYDFDRDYYYYKPYSTLYRIASKDRSSIILYHDRLIIDFKYEIYLSPISNGNEVHTYSYDRNGYDRSSITYSGESGCSFEVFETPFANSKNYGLNPSRSKAAVVADNGELYIFDLATKEYEFIGVCDLDSLKGTSDAFDKSPVFGDRYIVVGNKAFYHTGAGLSAFPANNKVVYGKQLGYAGESVDAGQEGKFYLLFS